VVLWGDAAEIPSTPVIDPTTATSVFVPYGAVNDVWNAAAGDTDTVVDVDVSYEVRRGNLVAGISTAPAPVKVNLYQAGGVDPDPDPVNRNLVAPTLMSASATDPADANLIPVEDFDQPADVTVSWMRVDGTTPAFALDDRLIINYAGLDQPERLIEEGDVAAAADLVVELAAQAIMDAGSGNKPLMYRIRRKLAGGGENDSLSPETMIDVHGTDEEPGGGKPLEDCAVPEAVGVDPNKPDRLIIGPVQAKDGADVVIPVYLNQKTTDLVTVTFTIFAGFYASAHATDPAPQNPRTFTVTRDQDSLDTPLKVTAPESKLMGEAGFVKQPLHAHVSYAIQARDETGANVGRPVESANYLLVDIDPRGG
jgi:hypothetical protein